MQKIKCYSLKTLMIGKETIPPGQEIELDQIQFDHFLEREAVTREKTLEYVLAENNRLAQEKYGINYQSQMNENYSSALKKTIPQLVDEAIDLHKKDGRNIRIVKAVRDDSNRFLYRWFE